MEAGLAWAKAAGGHKVTLTVFPHNHAARALYSKFGFMTEGTLRRAFRRNNGELWDGVIMGLVLDTTSPGRGQGAEGVTRAVQREARGFPEDGLKANGLVLRPGKLADAAELVAGIDDPEVHRWLDMLPDPYTVDDACEFLADGRRQWTEGTGTPLAITSNGHVAATSASASIRGLVTWARSGIGWPARPEAEALPRRRSTRWWSGPLTLPAYAESNSMPQWRTRPAGRWPRRQVSNWRAQRCRGDSLERFQPTSYSMPAYPGAGPDTARRMPGREGQGLKVPMDEGDAKRISPLLAPAGVNSGFDAPDQRHHPPGEDQGIARQDAGR